MKYFTLDYNANAPTPKCIKVPVNSEYGVAVKVYKDEQLVSADLSVDGATCTEGPDGWQLAELSSGNVQMMKMLDVTAYKEAEGETFEDTISARQPLDRTTVFTIQLGTFLSGVEISPSNISQFEMSSTLTPDAGGDPITETYELSGLRFYGKSAVLSAVLPTSVWWHVNDGQWEDQAKTHHIDTITLDVVGNRNVTAKTKKTYPKSTGTATYKLVFRFGEGFYAKFPFYVVQKDLGYFEK